MVNIIKIVIAYESINEKVVIIKTIQKLTMTAQKLQKLNQKNCC